jgi:cullin-associated NEDD8-dissociated protein 1
LLGAILATRPELLSTLYRDVSPVLISRFGDREETVRLEVWSTYGVFLSQTRVFGSATQASSGKRKRDSEGMEVEDTAQSLLKAQVASLAKALLTQMKSPKASSTTLQAGYELLIALVEVLPGSLSSQAALITSISKGVLSQDLNTTNSSVNLTCLSFLRVFFASHPPSSYSSAVPTLTPVLLRSLREKHPRISSESFRVFSALLTALRPVKAGDWADEVYKETLARLGKSDTDAEVRNAAEEVAGDLWVNAPDVVKLQDGKEWEAICRTAGNVDGAVKVVTRVANDGDVSEQWLNSMVEWTVTLLRRGGKAGKVEVFACLEALINKYVLILASKLVQADLEPRYPDVPPNMPASLLPTIKTFISLQDTSLLPRALGVVTCLLRRQPATTFPEVERDLLKDFYPLAISSQTTGAALEAVLGLFAALVEADPEIATRIVPNLTVAYNSSSRTDTSAMNVARGLAQVVKSNGGVAAATIAQFSKNIKVCFLSDHFFVPIYRFPRPIPKRTSPRWF